MILLQATKNSWTRPAKLKVINYFALPTHQGFDNNNQLNPAENLEELHNFGQSLSPFSDISCSTRPDLGWLLLAWSPLYLCASRRHGRHEWASIRTCVPNMVRRSDGLSRTYGCRLTKQRASLRHPKPAPRVSRLHVLAGYTRNGEYLRKSQPSNLHHSVQLPWLLVSSSFVSRIPL